MGALLQFAPWQGWGSSSVCSLAASDLPQQPQQLLVHLVLPLDPSSPHRGPLCQHCEFQEVVAKGKWVQMRWKPQKQDVKTRKGPVKIAEESEAKPKQQLQ